MRNALWLESLRAFARAHAYFWARLFWLSFLGRALAPRLSAQKPGIFYPASLRPGDKTRGGNWLTGDFTLPGGRVKNPVLHPFAINPPSREWLRALHGFDWLRHLIACDTLAAKSQARRALQHWIERHYFHPRVAWDGDVVARRLMAWSMVLPWILATPMQVLAQDERQGESVPRPQKPLWSDAMLLARVMRSMAQQKHWLEHCVPRMGAGLSRLMAVIGLVWTRLKLEPAAQPKDALWEELGVELEKQILADGGHISRSPAVLVDLVSDLLALYFAFRQYGLRPPSYLSPTLGRMFPLLRFFLHGDGRLAMFHGGAPCHAAEIQALLAHDRKQTPPFAFAPHSGYRRMMAGGVLLFIDTGAPAQGAHSTAAHAAPLAFEMSSGPHRLVVNCGPGQFFDRGWQRAMRLAAAHSCLSFDEAAPGTILSGALLGPRLAQGAKKLTARQIENEGGIWLELSHDGYVPRYATRVFRRLFLAQNGRDLRGEDLLIGEGKARRPKDAPDFSLRFHLHPDVLAQINREQEYFSLTLPNQEVWYFSAAAPHGTEIALDSSLYLGESGAVRPARQLVLSGKMHKSKLQIRWAIQRDAPNLNQPAEPTPRAEAASAEASA